MNAKKILVVLISLSLALGLVACDFSKLPGMSTADATVVDKDSDEDEDEDKASDEDEDEDEDKASDEDEDEDEDKASDEDEDEDEDKASDEDEDKASDEDEDEDENKASDEDEDEDEDKASDEDEDEDEDKASDEDEDEDEDKASDEDEDEDEDKASDEDEDEDKDETKKTDASKETEDAKPSETKKAGDSKVSDDWTNLEFEFDGSVYKIPFAYNDLETNGWSFDFSDYGYENGYELEPNEYILATISLENVAKYGEDCEVDVTIGIINNSDETLDAKECDVYSFECDTYWELDEGRPLPPLTLPGGLTWGATIDEITAVYGEPDDTYRSDSDTLKYTKYTYTTDDGQTMDLTIYDEEGLTQFEMRVY